MSYPGHLLVLDAGDSLAAIRHVESLDLDGIPAVDLERAARLLELAGNRAKTGAVRLRRHARQARSEAGTEEVDHGKR